MVKANSTLIRNDILFIPVLKEIITQKPENFHSNEFTKWWNPEWTISRAGFGAPGDGVRKVRGSNFLDGDILLTYLSNDLWVVRLSATMKISKNSKLTFEVAADPGGVLNLSVYIDHQKVFSDLIKGGPALD